MSNSYKGDSKKISLFPLERKRAEGGSILQQLRRRYDSEKKDEHRVQEFDMRHIPDSVLESADYDGATEGRVADLSGFLIDAANAFPGIVTLYGSYVDRPSEKYLIHIEDLDDDPLPTISMVKVPTADDTPQQTDN